MSSWSIDFSPMVPAPLFWAGAVLAAVLVILLLFRRSRGALLRALSLAALLLALSNPTLRQEERESLSNIAIVVVDESLSQSIAGRPGQPDEFDRRIEVLKAPRYGIVGSTRDIEARVVETGRRGRAGERVTLKIRREGRPDETRSTQIGRTVPIQMHFPHAGQNIVEIELETAPGELTPANNRVVVVAEGVRENLRVLLVSGEPHAGERVWRNLLKSDAAVDLVHFTILRPPQKQDGTPIHQLSLIAFPTRELFSERIKDFDLIIFDRYQHRDILQLLYYENIARYVEQGGALLVAAGDDYAGPMSLSRTPLSVVLPATPTGRVLERPFKARLSLDGAKHPVTRGLPGS